MPADEIRRCVTITNKLKPDLIVMTGTTSRPCGAGRSGSGAARLRFHGVFGSLGNHESITDTEESITRLFAAQGIHILRQERATIRLGGDTLNLIGFDDSLLDDKAVEYLVLPGTVNILLSHNPNDFDQAVELGFDLMLAGHTHGGQLSLEFLHRGLSSLDWKLLRQRMVPKNPADNSTSTAASEPPSSPSAWAQGQKSRCWNWCGGSEMPELRRTGGA
jgi:predicted MPP superfamily phosphohydrolase